MRIPSLFMLVAVSLHSSSARADSCFVFVGEMGNEKGGRADTDGPGSFGPLHEAMTLGCLEYAGFADGPNGVRALLVDFWGRGHWVVIGNYVGENSGRIVDITGEHIRIVQLERFDKYRYVERYRYIYRKDWR